MGVSPFHLSVSLGLSPLDTLVNDVSFQSILSDLRTLQVKSVVGDSKLPFLFRILYHDEKDDPENPLKGWLQGPLLIKVRNIPSNLASLML